MQKYNLTIIGSGPGGYVSALFAAQLGMKVCLIEKGELGGVCLNCGCIPTKTLVSSAKALSLIKDAEKFGVKVGKPVLDFASVTTRTKSVVDKLKKGIEFLLKSRKVDVKQGLSAVIVDEHHIKIGKEDIETENILIATGSSPVDIPAAKIDGKSILSSEGVLKIDSIPGELVIIGGGVIGCEFATIFNKFGSRVTIIEMMEHLIPGGDEELSKKLAAGLKKIGINVLTACKVEGTRYDKGGRIILNTSTGSELSCDKVLVSVGRRPNVSGFGLENIGVEVTKSGIKVDENMRTNLAGVYAIGDCVGGYMLAHVASHEGLVACKNIAGKKEKMDYSAVPSCTFTDPEIATCGMDEKVAKKNGLDVKVSRFYFRSLGKAHAIGKTDGFVKLVSLKTSGKIVGASIMGESASDLIAEVALAIRNGLSSSDVVSTIHAHPTMAEAILEAAHISEGKPLHFL